MREEVLNIESQIKELVDEDVAKALKSRNNYNVFEDERPYFFLSDPWGGVQILPSLNIKPRTTFEVRLN